MRGAVLMLLLGLLTASTACPPACDCKWKSGKESAICIRGNLTTIPAGLEGGTQLLDLTANPIATIGEDAFHTAGLLNLQKVFLAKCRIRAMDRYAFRYLINLVELDLSYNHISSVPSHIFDSISELRELKLNGNPIQRISNEAFVNVPQLVKLELTDCRVSFLESRAFAGLEQSLEWLKLDKNRLADVRPTTLTSLLSLHGLELSGNPWNCSCRLRPLKQWMTSHNIPSSVPAICRVPSRLSGKTWEKLQEDEFACSPSIAPLKMSEKTVEGNNVTMSCTFAGNPIPTVRWIRKNQPIANVSGLLNHNKMYIIHFTGTKSSLTIYSVEASDAGVYFCVASNKAGKVQNNVTLSVARKKTEAKLTGKLLGIGAGVAFVFLFISCVLFCFLGQPRKEPRPSHQSDNYEKIEMDRKGDNCFSEMQTAHKVHPTMCEYRGVPSGEEAEEEICQPPLVSTNNRLPSELTGAELSGLQQHVLRKEVLPTTSLYTTVTPDDRNFPDVVTTPPPTSSATLPRHMGSKTWYPRASSSQSPLLAGSRCGSSTGESSVSNSRRYSVESRAPPYYRSCGRRSASSLELCDPDTVTWHNPSLPASPHRHEAAAQPSSMSETPILNLLGSAVYDYHAAQLERFLEEYRTLQEELNRMKETCEELRGQRKENSDLYSLYNDIYRT